MLFLIEILKNTFLITGLVMVMMLLIEYLNVYSHGKSFQRLQKSPVRQVIYAALLGLVPGCIGGFAVVSLFTHGFMNFGALVAMMIATTGDESFFLFAMIPKQALWLNLLLFVLAVIVGLVLNKFVKRFPAPFPQQHFALHQHDHHIEKPTRAGILQNFKHLSFQRALLLVGLLLFIVAMFAGLLEHSHGVEGEHVHVHGEDCHHVHGTSFLFSERWMNILFAGVSVIAFILIAVVDEHFLESHLWGHIVKKHFLKILAWTFGALLLVELIVQNLDIQEWISDNPLPILLLAILIGLIPESGPHLVFITLFASGTIPFSILLANSIVQDGHTGLPLLAESKKGFLWAKLIKVLIGLTAGITGYVVGF